VTTKEQRAVNATFTNSNVLLHVAFLMPTVNKQFVCQQLFVSKLHANLWHKTCFRATQCTSLNLAQGMLYKRPSKAQRLDKQTA